MRKVGYILNPGYKKHEVKILWGVAGCFLALKSQLLAPRMSSLVLAPQLKYLTSHLIIVMEEEETSLRFAKRNETAGRK